MDYVYLSCMAFIAVTALGLVFFLNAEDNPSLNLPWRLFAVAIVIWSTGRTFMALAKTEQEALLAVRISYIGSIWLAPLWAWLTCKITNRKIPPLIFTITVVLFTCFTVFDFTPLFMSRMIPKMMFRFYDDSPGWVFQIWSNLFTLILIWSFYVLFKEMKKKSGRTSNQARTLFIAGLVGFGGSATTFPLVQNVHVYPFGVPVMAFFSIVIFMAVIQHQWMNLFLILRDTTIHIFAALISALLIVGAALATKSKTLLWIGPVLMALFLPFFFSRITRWIRRRINRTKWGEVDRYLEDIEEKASSLISASFSIRSLSSATLDVITSTFPVNEASIYFKKSKAQSLYLYSRMGAQNENGEINQDSEVYKALSGLQEVRSLDQFKVSPNEILEKFLRDSKGEVLCPLFTNKELTGLIILGPKVSLTKYHRRDLEALTFLSKKIEIACGLAMTSEKYVVVMGDWAHSLNQITKPIEQKAGLIRDFIDIYSREELKDAANVILNRTAELRHFHDYITNTSALSREILTGDFKKETVDIAKLLKDYVQNYKAENKDVVSMNIPDQTVKANINVTSIQRVVIELLANSLRHVAGKNGDARIVVSGLVAREGFEVSIKDNGDGLDPANIDRIWEAGWQQKDMNVGASGLGLSICKQIIEAHGGKVKAASPGKGQGMEISFVIPTVPA